jgi:hypothetical protein
MRATTLPPMAIFGLDFKTASFAEIAEELKAHARRRVLARQRLWRVSLGGG